MDRVRPQLGQRIVKKGVCCCDIMMQVLMAAGLRGKGWVGGSKAAVFQDYRVSSPPSWAICVIYI